MSVDGIARRALPFFFTCLLLMPTGAGAAEFFVDFGRTSSGDGSAANPWKHRTDINWSVVGAALSSGSVTIYFSSRAIWTDAQWTTIPVGLNANGSPSRRLTLDGQSRYNLVASGTAGWLSETISSNRAMFRTTIGQSGGTISVRENNAFVTIRGFHIISSASAGITLGEANPTLNMHDLIVENNVIEMPQSNHGVWFGFAEAGCYNVTVRNNTIVNTPLEGIYIGHYNYLPSTITGVVVENNTLINTGTAVREGDIDIKAGAFGAIVRYNTMYQTGTTGNVLAGVVIGASDVQLYGNRFYNLRAAWHPGDGGSAVQINADGADGIGKQLNNILVYNNLFYGNQQAGIKMFANRASITNAKILNNTIVGNGGNGLQAGASNGYTITITALVNNIFSANAALEIDMHGAVTVAAANHNVIYHPAGGNYLRYQGVYMSFAQWRALGFDANGVNSDPQLDSSYKLTSASPAVDRGVVRSEFSTDLSLASRDGMWDIGAYEYGAVSNPNVPAPPVNLRIVP